MNELIFILDGTQYPGAVVDDTKLKTTLQRDSKLGGFLESQDARIIFIRDAYDYLKAQFFDETNGFCILIDVEIQENCNGQIITLYNGIIKTSDIEFNHKECTAKTKLFDNSFFALIDNNRSIEVDLASNRTKNGDVITELDEYDVAMFDPNNGAALADCKAYRIFDLLQYVLSWISDNEITLVSDLLTNSPMMITGGDAIKNLGNSPTDFKFEFEDIINELDKKYKVGFKMGVNAANNITFNLELADDFFTTDAILNATDAIEVKTKADKKSLFAAIKIGSDKVDSGPVYAFPENANYYGFKTEQFQTTGQCNNDKVIDLVSKWVYSSNCIQAQLTGSDEYESNIFVIESENIDTGTLTASAVAHELSNFSSTERYYNITFNNINVLKSLYGFVHGTLIGESIQPANRFKAFMSAFYNFTTNPSNWTTPNNCRMFFVDYNDLINYPLPTTYCDDPFPFDNVSNDPNNNYDPVAYEYIVPSDGLYNFHVFLDTILTDNLPSWPSCFHVRLYAEFVLMDSTSTITKEVQIQTFRFDAPGNFGIDTAATFNCRATDRVHVRFQAVNYTDPIIGCLPNTQPIYVDLIFQPLTSYFEATGGFVFNEVNQVKVITHEFTYPLTGEQFKSIQETPEGLITVTTFDDEFTGWIDRAEYQHWTNDLKLRIKTNN